MAKKKPTRKTIAGKRAIGAAATSKTSPKNGRNANKRRASRDSQKTKHRAVTSTASQRGRRLSPAKKRYLRAEGAFAKFRKDLLRLPGVHGLSLGYRYKKGKPTKELAIRLHVGTEEDKRLLKTNYKYSPKNPRGLRRQYGGVPIDIVVWTFRLAATGTPLKDGACIRGDGGRGTMGTTVFVTLNGETTAVWLTAAHVVSEPVATPTSPITISKCAGNTTIGTVTPEHYFRNKHVDAALIVPNPPLDEVSTLRAIHELGPDDKDRAVTIKGAVNYDKIGTISSLHYYGTIYGRNHKTEEYVEDHFLVKPHDSSIFAEGGDSGAIVFLGDELVGQLRAVEDNTKIAVVTRLSITRGEVEDFRL